MSDTTTYASQYRDIDFRQFPERYRIGRGEQGVLIAEPYKSELLPHWQFATPDKAALSAATIYEMYQQYLSCGDFVGMDMARKYLQMGFTRARRYANYKGGKKYDGAVPNDKKGQSGAHGRPQLQRTVEDEQKAESARIFYGYYKKVLDDEEYQRRKVQHMQRQRSD